jgi:transglutaminase-like putative cysteine protease
MLVKTNDPVPFSPYERQYGDFPPPPAYYWLAVTFDTYRYYGWVNSPTTNVDLEANKLQLPSVGPSRTVTQTVRLVETPGNLLFTAGYPLRVDQPSRFNIRTNQDWAGTILETGESYIAQSWLSLATADELRYAGTDYPEWLAKRYLALPDSLPSRVRSLALELTATAPTPYDRAIALEEYLRKIPYSLDVSSRPADRDVVDYFLFDLKQGYCDYYATSMVVMARAAGLPARLAIGYAPSPYDYVTFQYVVRESEAHSWTQIYFPGYGWIDFEPTGGRPPINRSTGEEAEEFALPELPDNFDLDQALAANQTWWDTMPLWQFLLIGLSGIASIVMTGVLIVWIRDQRLARLPVHQLVPLLESRLETGARQLGTPVTMGATPLEFQTAFLHHLEYLTKRRAGLQNIIPSAADIASLVNAFVYLRYGPQPTKLEGNTYLNIWRRLRWRLWGTIIVKKVRRIR